MKRKDVLDKIVTSCCAFTFFVVVLITIYINNNYLKVAAFSLLIGITVELIALFIPEKNKKRRDIILTITTISAIVITLSMMAVVVVM